MSARELTGERAEDLADLDDFARANARGARFDFLRGAVHDRVNASQVGVPAPFRHVMRVTDMISVLGTFSTKVADPCHFHTSLIKS
jgi:hypothetical protein